MMTTNTKDLIGQFLALIAIALGIISAALLLVLVLMSNHQVEDPEPPKVTSAETSDTSDIKALQTRIRAIEREITVLRQMHEIAAHDRNRLLDGLISVYDIVKDIGFVGDSKRKVPKLRMWRCVDPQVPVGLVQ